MIMISAQRGQSLGLNQTWREVFSRLLQLSALVTLARPAVDLEFTEYLRRVDAPRGGNVTEIMMLVRYLAQLTLLYKGPVYS